MIIPTQVRAWKVFLLVFILKNRLDFASRAPGVYINQRNHVSVAQSAERSKMPQVGGAWPAG